MRRAAALALVVLSVAGTAALHLRVESRDGRWLLLVDDVPRDPLGRLAQAWHGLRRDCSSVVVLQPASVEAQAARAAVAAHSPPDSASARLVSVLAAGEWRIVEARFERLPPVVVVLHGPVGAMRVIDPAVWSGSTWPWEPGPLIRRWLRERAPGLPPGLLACFDTRRDDWSPQAAAARP